MDFSAQFTTAQVSMDVFRFDLDAVRFRNDKFDPGNPICHGFTKALQLNAVRSKAFLRWRPPFRATPLRASRKLNALKKSADREMVRPVHRLHLSFHTIRSHVDFRSCGSDIDFQHSFDARNDHLYLSIGLLSVRGGKQYQYHHQIDWRVGPYLLRLMF